jgi:hypothetical protein
VRGTLAERFSQVIGAAETEVADLVETGDACLATGSFGDQQRPHRFDRTVAGLGEAGGPPGEHCSSSLDGISRVGLPGPPAGRTVGSIDFDHHEPAAPQVASQTSAVGTSAVGTSALATDAFHLTKPDQPVAQLGEPGGGRRERLDRQHTTVDIHDRSDMNMQVGVDTTGDRTRRFYDGHGHPFSLHVVKGWHARPGKETVSSTLRLTASSITLRNGACLVPARARVDKHPTNFDATTPVRPDHRNH